MAPIDPKQILQAFDPVCSKTGGIISTKEVPRLSGLIKKYSKKLVSKCTYLNILLSTDETVLEEFLKFEGWNTMYNWFQDATEKKNQPFLFELIKVLDKCPVTLDRLRENNIIPLLNNLIASESGELKMNAKKLREKWKYIANRENEKRMDVKRKKEVSNSENDQVANNSPQKKLKLDENAIPKPVLNNQNKGEKSSNADNSKSSKVGKSVPCKLGKSRSIGLLDVDTKPVNHTPPANSNSFAKGSLLFNHTASTPTMPLNKLGRTIDKGIQLIDAQPLPTTELHNSSSGHSTKHIIKDSTGFMDALSSLPNSSKMKKKKKLSIDKSTIDKPITGTKSTDADLSQDMDLDSSCSGFATAISNDGQRSPADNSMDHSSNTSTNEIEFLTFSNPQPYDPNRLPNKSILMYVPRGNKRKITWPNEDQMEKVKFFELDDKERCNVNNRTNNNNFVVHRREEMEKERDQLHNARNIMKYFGNNPGNQLMKWRCIPIDLSDITIHERSGINSQERGFQEQRLMGVLEEIDLARRIEFPKEPDTEQLNTSDDAQTKIIPLDEENRNLNDYSDRSYSIAGEPQPTVYQPDSNSFFANNQLNVPPQQQSPNSQFFMNNANQLLNNPIIYNQPSQMYNPVQNSIINQTPAEQTNQWTPSNWETNNNVPNHRQNGYYNKKSSINFRNKNGSKRQTAVCKFWSKSGNCRHGSNCHFLHSK